MKIKIYMGIKGLDSPNIHYYIVSKLERNSDPTLRVLGGMNNALYILNTSN
jgi:hypothetical protein